MVGQFNRAMLSLARAARGFTQSELAKAAHVTQALISKLESGLTVDPSQETVEAIAMRSAFLWHFSCLTKGRTECLNFTTESEQSWVARRWTQSRHR